MVTDRKKERIGKTSTSEGNRPGSLSRRRQTVSDSRAHSLAGVGRGNRELSPEVLSFLSEIGSNEKQLNRRKVKSHESLFPKWSPQAWPKPSTNRTKR